MGTCLSAISIGCARVGGWWVLDKVPGVVEKEPFLAITPIEVLDLGSTSE